MCVCVRVRVCEMNLTKGTIYYFCTVSCACVIIISRNFEFLARSLCVWLCLFLTSVRFFFRLFIRLPLNLGSTVFHSHFISLLLCRAGLWLHTTSSIHSIWHIHFGFERTKTITTTTKSSFENIFSSIIFGRQLYTDISIVRYRFVADSFFLFFAVVVGVVTVVVVFLEIDECAINVGRIVVFRLNFSFFILNKKDKTK